MKIQKVIISTNDSVDYIEFLPMISRAWEKLFDSKLELLVGYASKNEPLDWMEDFAHIERFWDDEIPSCNMAKVSRLLLACRYPDDYCMLSDMDMLPLQSSYFSDRSDQLEDDKILFMSADAYPQEFRYPICYILAKGSVFKEIVNPNGLSEKELLDSWKSTQTSYDNVTKMPFSDESLFKCLLIKWGQPGRLIHLSRGWFENIALNRIDRSKWSIRQSTLEEGKYIDCHLLRPLSKHEKAIKPLLDYLGISWEQ